MTRLLRSWMFVPGDRPRMIDKAIALPVDAIILDLEDGVAPSAKDAARGHIADALDRVVAGADTASTTQARYVRINAIGHERMSADLAAVLRPGLEGLVLPKVETPDQIALVDRAIEQHESERGLRVGAIRLLVAIESPQGLINSAAVARASARVAGLMFGAEDFSRELGLPLRREHEAQDLLYARSMLVIAAAAAGIQVVDGVWTDLADMEGLQRLSAQSRRLGFTGMSLIHPSQIEAVNAAFTPSAAEIEYCTRVVNAFDDARARGEGAVAFGGQLLDAPIVERARRTLTLASSIERRSS